MHYMLTRDKNQMVRLETWTLRVGARWCPLHIVV